MTIFLKRFPPKWVLIASIILACIVGYDANISDFLVLSRTFVFYPFFFLGYCIDPVWLKEKLSSKWIKITGFMIIFIVAVVCFCATDSIYFVRNFMYGASSYDFLANAGLSALVVYGGFFRLIYYAATIVLCIAFFAIIPNQCPRVPYLATIGRRTLQIYVLHRPILYILFDGLHMREWFVDAHINSFVWIPIALLITVGLSLPFWEKPIRAIAYPREHKVNEDTR